MAEAEGALDLVVGSWVGGSERKRKSQPGVAWHGLSAKLCRLSCVLLLLLLLLAACVLAVLSAAVCEGG